MLCVCVYVYKSNLMLLHIWKMFENLKQCLYICDSINITCIFNIQSLHCVWKSFALYADSFNLINSLHHMLPDSAVFLHNLHIALLKRRCNCYYPRQCFCCMIIELIQRIAYNARDIYNELKFFFELLSLFFIA